MLEPTQAEVGRRKEVLRAVLEHIRSGTVIRLPDYDPAASEPSERFAMQSVGIEPNAFGGTVGEFRYQFEGEDDLLHLFVTRSVGAEITAEEGQAVVAYLLVGVPTALIWLKPGKYTQHFYLGHDELIDKLIV